MLKFEKKIIDFIKNNYIIFSLIFVTLIALYIRYKMLYFESGDYVQFLKPWFDYLRDNGKLLALKNYPGDYNAPYMTIMALLTYLPISSLYSIKIVSIFFDFILAIASCKLVGVISKDNKILKLFTYILVLFFPQVLINSALWGQCDVIYTSFIVFSLYYLLKEKYIHSFIFLGLAFSFKLQFIFVLPLYVVIYIMKEKYSILHFLIIPLVNFILCLPVIIIGKPIKDVLMIYLNQTSTYKTSLTLNFPNFYNFLTIGLRDVNLFYKLGTILAVIACLSILIFIYVNKIKLDNEKTILLAILFMVVITYLLPGMHERYLFVGEILMLLYYINYRKYLPMLVIMIIGPLLTYSSFLFGIDYNYYTYLNIAYLVILVYFIKNTLLYLKK